MEIRFVTAQSQDFRGLAAQLDAYYYTLVGDVQDRYAEPNRPENMDALAVVYDGGEAIACGAWKSREAGVAEIKRIFVLPQFRRRGVASDLIRALEVNAMERGIRKFILETATTTGQSHSLYLSLGYRVTDYYGSPAGEENCLCFVKEC